MGFLFWSFSLIIVAVIMIIIIIVIIIIIISGISICWKKVLWTPAYLYAFQTIQPEQKN